MGGATGIVLLQAARLFFRSDACDLFSRGRRTFGTKSIWVLERGSCEGILREGNAVHLLPYLLVNLLHPSLKWYYDQAMVVVCERKKRHDRCIRSMKSPSGMSLNFLWV